MNVPVIEARIVECPVPAGCGYQRAGELFGGSWIEDPDTIPIGRLRQWLNERYPGRPFRLDPGE